MKKICIIGIFILLTLIPISSAVDDVYNNVDNVSRENLIIEPLDNNQKEIISKIDGSCLESSFYGIGVFFNVEIWAGYDTSIRIAAYTSLFPPKGYIVHSATYIKAPIFIGYTTRLAPDKQTVHGIAIYDIEWS